MNVNLYVNSIYVLLACMGRECVNLPLRCYCDHTCTFAVTGLVENQSRSEEELEVVCGKLLDFARTKWHVIFDLNKL